MFLGCTLSRLFTKKWPIFLNYGMPAARKVIILGSLRVGRRDNFDGVGFCEKAIHHPHLGEQHRGERAQRVREAQGHL